MDICFEDKLQGDLTIFTSESLTQRTKTTDYEAQMYKDSENNKENLSPLTSPYKFLV